MTIKVAGGWPGLDHSVSSGREQEVRRQAKGAWGAESRNRDETKSFIRKHIKIPAPRARSRRGGHLRTGRKYLGRGSLHQHTSWYP